MSKSSQTMNQNKQSSSVIDIVQSMTSHSNGMPTSKKTKSALTLTYTDTNTGNTSHADISITGEVPDIGKMCQLNIPSLKPYCDIYNNCVNQKTAGLSNCLDSFSGFICASNMATDEKDAVCYSANGLVNFSQNKNIGSNAEILMDWYKNKLSPCVTNQCKGSKYPVNQTDFENAPETIVKDLCIAGGGGTDAGLAIFFRDYWWIFLIIIVIFIVLIVSLLAYEAEK